MFSTLTFNAGNVSDVDEDTVGSLITPCSSRYVNVKLSSVASPNNSIHSISSIDVTQFVAVTNQTYTFNLNSEIPIGRTYTFDEVIGSNPIQLEGSYNISKPKMECGDQLSWILYSVANKYPVVTVDNILSPPNVKATHLAVVPLIPVLKTAVLNREAYYELYFPTSDIPGKPYQISFQSSTNNVVFATRINGTEVSWDYNNGFDLPDTWYQSGSYVRNMQLEIT